MPIYEYECEKCSIREEVLASISDSECNELICNSCLEPMKKLISAGGFRLIGEWTSTTKPPIDWD